MNTFLKERGINETVATIKGNTAKLHALPEDVQKMYKSYVGKTNGMMRFRDDDLVYLNKLN